MRRALVFLWQLGFARNLSREVGSRVTLRDLRTEAERLPRSNMPGTDSAMLFNLTLARSLHCATTFLERQDELQRTDAVRLAGAAFGTSGTWLVRGGIRLWLRLERDPFDGVMKRGPSIVARAVWGDGMAVEDRKRPDGVSLCVLSCLFHEYFRDAGRSDLTGILCAWDTAWLAQVNASTKAIRVDVRDTISRGGKICEFAFRRTGLN